MSLDESRSRAAIADHNAAKHGLLLAEWRALAGGRKLFKYEKWEIDERYPGCS